MHANSRNRAAALGCLLAVWSAALAEPARAQDHDGRLDTIRQRGELAVLSFPYPASTFVRETSDGGYTGLDYDIMEKFAGALEVELTIRPVDSFDQLIPRLLAGEGDLIASSFSITPARAEVVRFSDGYFPVLLMVAARKGSGLTSADDLDGLTALAVKGSSQEARLLQIPGVVVEHRAQNADVHRSLAGGEGDFALFDSTTVAAQLDDYPQLEVAFQLPDRQYYGYAAAPGSDLLPALDEHLAALKREGLIFHLIRRHLGDKAAEIYRLASEGD
jgi:ABC-type amino acid transport substrate-binding protein